MNMNKWKGRYLLVNNEDLNVILYILKYISKTGNGMIEVLVRAYPLNESSKKYVNYKSKWLIPADKNDWRYLNEDKAIAMIL